MLCNEYMHIILQNIQARQQNLIMGCDCHLTGSFINQVIGSISRPSHQYIALSIYHICLENAPRFGL